MTKIKYIPHFQRCGNIAAVCWPPKWYPTGVTVRSEATAGTETLHSRSRENRVQHKLCRVNQAHHRSDMTATHEQVPVGSPTWPSQHFGLARMVFGGWGGLGNNWTLLSCLAELVKSSLTSSYDLFTLLFSHRTCRTWLHVEAVC